MQRVKRRRSNGWRRDAGDDRADGDGFIDRRDPMGNGVTLVVHAKVDWRVADLVEVVELHQLNARELDVLLSHLIKSTAGHWVVSQRDESVASFGERYICRHVCWFTQV